MGHWLLSQGKVGQFGGLIAVLANSTFGSISLHGAVRFYWASNRTIPPATTPPPLKYPI